MTTPLKIECQIHFRRQGAGARKVLELGPAPIPEVRLGRIPRVARLVALAHRLEGLVHDGAVADYATLARLSHVTDAHISQIMSLLYLAPDIQEHVLFLPRIEHGRDPIILAHLLPIAATLEWRRQRRMWRQLTVKLG